MLNTCRFGTMYSSPSLSTCVTNMSTSWTIPPVVADAISSPMRRVRQEEVQPGCTGLQDVLQCQSTDEHQPERVRPEENEQGERLDAQLPGAMSTAR